MREEANSPSQRGSNGPGYFLQSSQSPHIHKCSLPPVTGQTCEPARSRANAPPTNSVSSSCSQKRAMDVFLMAAHRLAYCRHISGPALVSLTTIRSTKQLEQPHGGHGTPDCPSRGKSGVDGWSRPVSLSESRSNIRVAVTLINTLERRPSAVMHDLQPARWCCRIFHHY